MDQIKIAIVDDHILFSRSLEMLINSFPEYKVLFTASDGQDFIGKISKKFKPDIVLVDQLMPVMDGFQTVMWLKDNYPEVLVIVLSMNHNEETVLKMVKGGVRGYLLKDAELKEFKLALDTVARQEYFYPKYVTNYLVHSLNQPIVHNNATADLNSKEIEFIKLASTELTYKEIADQMCVSERTVDGYRTQLFQKLNLKNRVGLVLYALRNRIIDSL
jgi:DNA-binding NarL/FixJ family response regulator